MPFEVLVKMPPALRPYLAAGPAGQQAASTWLGGIVEPDKIRVRVMSLGKVGSNLDHWCCAQTLLPVGYRAIITLRTHTLEVEFCGEVVSNPGSYMF